MEKIVFESVLLWFNIRLTFFNSKEISNVTSSSQKNSICSAIFLNSNVLYHFLLYLFWHIELRPLKLSKTKKLLNTFCHFYSKSITLKNANFFQWSLLQLVKLLKYSPLISIRAKLLSFHTCSANVSDHFAEIMAKYTQNCFPKGIWLLHNHFLKGICSLSAKLFNQDGWHFWQKLVF